MRAEYDFSGGVRGKYARDLREHGYTIRVEDANGAYTANKALRAIIAITPPQVVS